MVNYLCKPRKMGSSGARLPQEPDWYAEFRCYSAAECGMWVEWSDLAPFLYKVRRMSECFQEWLAACRCRLLIMDCWTHLGSMAACAAASALDIRRVELQHGVQGEDHYSYSNWRRAPAEGYDVMPSHFWFWGRADADRFQRSNALPVSLIVGGNGWLQLWSEESGLPGLEAETQRVLASTQPFRRSILVTLQLSVPHSHYVSLIENSPPDWCWLVRSHRSERITSDESALTAANHPGVNCHVANSAPLYALMKVADVHVTGFSTCALEALAFGKPSVLIHENALGLYGRFLAGGFMRFSEDTTEQLSWLGQASWPDGDDYRKCVTDIFADGAAYEAAIKELVC